MTLGACVFVSALPPYIFIRHNPRRLSLAVLERFQTAVLEMDEPGIAATCPLLAPLGLATQGQELYLGFARRALEAELQAGVNGDEASPATQRLPEIYNVAAAFLRRFVGSILRRGALMVVHTPPAFITGVPQIPK